MCCLVHSSACICLIYAREYNFILPVSLRNYYGGRRYTDGDWWKNFSQKKSWIRKKYWYGLQNDEPAKLLRLKTLGFVSLIISLSVEKKRSITH